MGTFEKSIKQIREVKQELKNGVRCECGSLMHYTGNQMLCEEGKKLVDKYEVQCEKCNKIDHFVARVPHLNV